MPAGLIPSDWLIFAIGIAAWLAVGLVFLHRHRKNREHVPGLPCDGWPLSVPERERLEQIERGYGPAPRVARRVR